MFQFKFRSFFVVFILHFTFSYVIWNDFLVSGMQVRQGKPCLRVEERLFWFSFSLALFQSAPFNCDHCLIDLLWSCLLVSWAHCALRTQPVAPWDFPSALIFNLVHSKCMKIICIYIIFFHFNAKIFIWIASKHMYLDSTCACYADAGYFAIKNNLLKCILCFFDFGCCLFHLFFFFIRLCISLCAIRAKVK